METPSSTARRVTRSQTSTTLAASNNIPVSRKMEDSEKNLSKSRQRKCQNQQQQQQQDRCALVDISNDSPIVGLASGILETPLSSIVKQRGSRVKKTPGSGEALLRGQVKTLLQKVEEEAEISKLSMDIDIRPFLQQLANSSPMSLLAPTPANTPQIPNINYTATGLASVSPISVVQEQLISQVVNEIVDGKNKEDPESEKTMMLSRSLFLDFSDKSEVSECFSELTEVTQGDSSGSFVEKPQGSTTEDDGDSVWSMQVNASSTHDDEEEEEEIAENEDDEEEDYYEGVEEEEEYGDDDEEGLDLDELCAGLNNICVNERGAPAGKHTRFVYDSDEEIVEEVEVLHLKGLPTPKGKHIRFPDEEEKEKSAF